MQTNFQDSSIQYSSDAFIKLAMSCGVLRFGSFTLKSGRQSPYFFNAGLFYEGKSLMALGRFYANALIASGIQFEHLFGPAYKGLPLATATAVALAERGIDVTVTFNRKEVKNHGEGGQLIGAPLSGNTVIIDDVITAGTAFREALSLINSHGGHLTTVVIALNRCERGIDEKSAISEIEAQGIRVLSLISLYDLIAWLEKNNRFEELERVHKYQQQYGV